MWRMYVISLMSTLIIGTYMIFATKNPEVHSPGIKQVLSNAQENYENRNYLDAVQAYQKLLDGGYDHPSIYYNLGNTYYQMGDWGMAILNYRRAASIAPRDADIRTNLALTRNRVTDQIGGESASTFSGQIAQFSQSWLSSNEAAMLTLAAWLALSILLIYLTHPQKRIVHQSLVFFTIAGAICFALLGYTLGNRIYIENGRPECVVIANEIQVTEGPGSQYANEFLLHNGDEATILETRGSWKHLSLPGNKLNGWVPENAIMVINLSE